MKSHTSAGSQESGRIPSLDGLRFFSILLVIISHTIPYSHIPLPPSVLSIFAVGDLGVKVFFVISGFLITSILLAELERSGRISIPQFYFRRSLRIFPAYYFFLLVVFLLGLKGLVETRNIDLIRAATYTTNYFSGSWVTGHTWSLSVEEQFYLIWPLTLSLLGRKHYLKFVWMLVFLCPLIRLAYFHSSVVNAEYGMESVADSLAVGCLLAGILPSLQSNERLSRWIFSPLFVLVPLAALALQLLASRPSLLPPALFRLLGISVQNFAIMLCIFYCVSVGKGRLFQLLNLKWIAFFGAMSYSIYLWQQVFLNPHAKNLNIYEGLVGLLLVAGFSFFVIEQPFLRLRRVVGKKLFPRV